MRRGEMMKCTDLAEKFGLEVLTASEKDISIKGVYIGDLLSIVMAKAKQDYAWITIQTHLNIVAVADLLELSCIIIVENMDLEPDALEKAMELEIPVFKTKKSAYNVACDFNQMGII